MASPSFGGRLARRCDRFLLVSYQWPNSSFQRRIDLLPGNGHQTGPDHCVQNVVGVLGVDRAFEPAQSQTALALVRDVVSAHTRLHDLLPLGDETLKLRAPVPARGT